jgi:hypothetical protein
MTNRREPCEDRRGVVAGLDMTGEKPESPGGRVLVPADDREPVEVVALSLDQKVESQSRMTVGITGRSPQDLRRDGPSTPVENRSVESRVFKTGESKLGPDEPGPPEVGPGEIGVREVGVLKIDVAKVGPSKVRVSECRFRERRATQARSEKGRVAQIDAPEIGLGQEGMIEREASKVGVAKAHARSDERVDRAELAFGSNRGDFPPFPAFDNLQ